jgi:hypothetical protein
MLTISLKRFVIVIFISFCVLVVRAQQVHFIYLQTEGSQPFYVKLDKKIMSSSQAGYLILPKLADGNYNLRIGFPKNEFPEENFQVSINKKNEGFLLKNFNEKGWGLFNMQSFNVVMGGNTGSPANGTKSLQADPFSKMLANVVKDSTILQKNEQEKEVAVATKVDSPLVIVPAPSLLSPATRLLSKKNNDGMEMVYVDHNNNLNDTIRIFIPAEKALVNKNSQSDVAQIEKPAIDPMKDSTKDSAKNLISNSDNNSAKVNADTTNLISQIDSSKNNIVEKADTVSSKKITEETPVKTKNSDSVKNEKNVSDNLEGEIVVLPKVVKSSSINSDCKAFAADEDFLKLRKKMASENSNDNMIKAAKKAFHSKCFSTEQIKNLSFLFLTDEGKYMFFDAAYAYVSDSDQYSTLQSQLTDSYYINRFKAMIHK